MTTPKWLTTFARWCRRRWTAHARAEARIKRQLTAHLAERDEARTERQAELAALQAELDRIGP